MSRKLANTIRKFWAARGLVVNVRVEKDRTGARVIVSDMIGGWPALKYRRQQKWLALHRSK
jgi:hypothetical protein